MSTTSRTVYLVSSEHFAIPECPTQVFSDPIAAANYALKLTNSLREFVGLPPALITTPWRTAMEEARQKRAADLMVDTEELAENPELDGSVDIAEFVLNPVLYVRD